MLGYKTWFIDIRGCVEWLFNQIKIQFVPLKEVTICTGLFNRSLSFQKHLLASLQSINYPEKVTLSVFDCKSTDVEALESEIRKTWKGKLIFRAEKVNFSRSYAFNQAIYMAQTELLFICDADVSVPVDLVKKCNRNVSKHLAWFPVCFWLKEGKSTFASENGTFFTEGTGLFACSKKQISKTGAYDQNFTTWGKEDWDIFFRFYKNGIMPFRTRENELLHHWHESQKPTDFTPLF